MVFYILKPKTVHFYSSALMSFAIFFMLHVGKTLNMIDCELSYVVNDSFAV